MSLRGARGIGAWGEEQCRAFLKRQGYHIIEANFRTRRGEIDIIARVSLEGEAFLCFIEVKTRTNLLSLPEYATEVRKRQKIYRAAVEYCVSRCIDLDAIRIRFEHISLYVDRSLGRLRFQKRLLPIISS